MNRRFTRVTQATRHLFAAFGVWAIAVAPLWAQVSGEEPEEKTYVPSYMIIMFAMGLALLIICRSGKRTISFRRD